MVEQQNHGCWLKIFIPAMAEAGSLATIQNNRGSTLRDVRLNRGNNAIDISLLEDSALQVKVETGSQTILKTVQISGL